MIRSRYDFISSNQLLTARFKLKEDKGTSRMLNVLFKKWGGRFLLLFEIQSKQYKPAQSETVAILINES